MTKFPKVERPRLALWMYERDLRPKDLEEDLQRSFESIRCYCLPFGNPMRRVPDFETMGRIHELTEGEVGPPDFYPASLRPTGVDAGASTEAERPADEDWASRNFLDAATA